MCTAEERGCAALPQGDGSEASTGSRGAEGSPFPPIQLPGAQGQAGLASSVALLLPLSQAEDSINLRPRLPQPCGLQGANRECAKLKTHRSDAGPPRTSSPRGTAVPGTCRPMSHSADSTRFASLEASWGLSTVCSPRPSLQPRVRRAGASRRELSTRSPFPPEVHRVAPVVTFPQSGVLGANPTYAATPRCPPS
uniref:Uncharacterized protein n=1 Tax=Rousettus aegyptiacus TaxID=9407 RepID=A0A7J8B9M5_ROUAE|nr:hypothetical protein HJG63_009964 [Rousettus aegyptiacus]